MPKARLKYRDPELTIQLPPTVYAGSGKDALGRTLILQGNLDDMVDMLSDALTTIVVESR